MILYPFIEGKNGYELSLSDQKWLDFGAALRQAHGAQIPAELRRRIPRESYSPRLRKMVLDFQAQVEKVEFNDPIAANLARFMRSRRAEISYIIYHASLLGHSDLPPEYIPVTMLDGIVEFG